AERLEVAGGVLGVREDVHDVDDITRESGPPDERVTCRRTWLTERLGLVRVRETGSPERRSAICAAVPLVDGAVIGFAEAGGLLDQRFEGGSQGERRPADRLEDLRYSGLLLARLLRLVEEPSVLARDDPFVR